MQTHTNLFTFSWILIIPQTKRRCVCGVGWGGRWGSVSCDKAGKKRRRPHRHTHKHAELQPFVGRIPTFCCAFRRTHPPNHQPTTSQPPANHQPTSLSGSPVSFSSIRTSEIQQTNSRKNQIHQTQKSDEFEARTEIFRMYVCSSRTPPALRAF